MARSDPGSRRLLGHVMALFVTVFIIETISRAARKRLV